MKLGAREIGSFLSRPDRQAQAVLIYGPDGGLVRERSKIISNAILGKNSDPINRVELSGAQIKSDPAILFDELNSLSLMGGRRVVILRDLAEKTEPIIKSACEQGKSTAYLIVEADELGPASALRKLFEKEEHLAALPCYLEDARGMEELIRNTLTGYGLNVTQDALAYLTDNLGNDRMVTQSELAKIALYMGEEKEVTLRIAMALTGDNASESMEGLCHSVALAQAGDTDRLLTHLLHDGTQPVAIVRALMRHFQRLDLVLGHMEAGQGRAEAIKMLRPPVFFKSVPLMERALARFNTGKIAYVLNVLLRTEKELKSGTVPPELVVGNAILAIEGI